MLTSFSLKDVIRTIIAAHCASTITHAATRSAKTMPELANNDFSGGVQECTVTAQTPFLQKHLYLRHIPTCVIALHQKITNVSDKLMQSIFYKSKPDRRHCATHVNTLVHTTKVCIFLEHK
jgi:hypothetical protein